MQSCISYFVETSQLKYSLVRPAHYFLWIPHPHVTYFYILVQFLKAVPENCIRLSTEWQGPVSESECFAMNSEMAKAERESALTQSCIQECKQFHTQLHKIALK